MSLDADAILERRRLRRRVTFWRGAAILMVALAVVAVAWRVVPRTGGDQVAKINLSGVIVDAEKRHKLFQDIEKADRVKAVMLVINSPGGGVAASEEIYLDLRRIAAKKPVVALVDTLAASGGYVAAIGADRIFARETSLTGSIGVLIQYPNFAKLLETVGVQVESVKSSPLKAAPSGFEPTSPEARAALQALVADSFAWFKGKVSERRKLTGEALDKVTDGRVFTGRQALSLGLIDQIGSEEEARAWLEAEKKIPKSLPAREWKPREDYLSGVGLARVAIGAAAEAIGMPAFAERIRQGQGSTMDIEALDGLLAVWHPTKN